LLAGEFADYAGRIGNSGSSGHSACIDTISYTGGIDPACCRIRQETIQHTDVEKTNAIPD